MMGQPRAVAYRSWRCPLQEPHVRARRGCCHLGARQIGMGQQVQAWRPLLDPAQHQVLDRIEADHAALQRLRYGGPHIVEGEALDEPQHLDVFPLAGFAHPRFK